ncbi:MAG: 2-oxoacid:acceptor oxidoreductase family protein [Desulfobacterales bacterium]|jgi:pyruvate ferredoxin oxidoreductase gamma subunit/2-oxoisovalerate ferredoxin oxidoreductase gamma subunit
MHEIRFHGRGGQGTVVASVLLAKAFFSAGYYVQTFPVFGVERRGAPVEAFLRLDRHKIIIRSNVYTPDHILVQDIKLLESFKITAGLKPGGWVLLNTSRKPDNLDIFSGYRLACVDATGIAIHNHLGTHTHPIINTAMIGAFTRMLEMPPLKMVYDAIREDIAIAPEQNIMAAKQAHDQAQLIGMIK